MENSILKDLEHYITEESNASLLYLALADIAPNDEAKRLLSEFSSDEHGHAEAFKQIYRALTGKTFEPVTSEPDTSGDLRDILLERVLNESGDFRIYTNAARDVRRSTALRDAFLNAATDETVHALRLLYLLSE